MVVGQCGTKIVKTDNLTPRRQLILMPNCPFLLSWCQIVRCLVFQVPNCLTTLVSDLDSLRNSCDVLNHSFGSQHPKVSKDKVVIWD